jgi:hypothetical protein
LAALDAFSADKPSTTTRSAAEAEICGVEQRPSTHPELRNNFI